jgi:hypothetical protein
MVENLEQPIQSTEEVIEFESEKKGMEVFDEVIKDLKIIDPQQIQGSLKGRIEILSQNLKGKDDSRPIWLTSCDHEALTTEAIQVYFNEENKLCSDVYYNNVSFDHFDGYIDLSNGNNGIYKIIESYEGNDASVYYIIKDGKIVDQVIGDFRKPYEIAKKYNLDFRYLPRLDKFKHFISSEYIYSPFELENKPDGIYHVGRTIGSGLYSVVVNGKLVDEFDFSELSGKEIEEEIEKIEKEYWS